MMMEQQRVYVPHPVTEQGFFTRLRVDQERGEWLCYGTPMISVLRNAQEPLDCVLYRKNQAPVLAVTACREAVAATGDVAHTHTHTHTHIHTHTHTDAHAHGKKKKGEKKRKYVQQRRGNCVVVVFEAEWEFPPCGLCCVWCFFFFLSLGREDSLAECLCVDMYVCVCVCLCVLIVMMECVGVFVVAALSHCPWPVVGWGCPCC